MALSPPNLGEIKDSSLRLSVATPTKRSLLMTFDPEGIVDWSGVNAFASPVFGIEQNQNESSPS